MRTLILCLGAAVILLLLPGCRTTSNFPRPDATWSTRVGQLQYVGPERSVIGECIVSQRGATDLQLDFSSGPGFPLLKLWRSGERVRAEGLFARGRWQGSAQNAPESLRGWMKATAALSRAPGKSRVTLLSAETGERFVFVFAR